LALEALDDPRFRSLVAYIDDAAQTGGGLIESLIDRGRHAIVVIDECPAERHIKLNAKLTTNPAVKLITIGDVGTSRSAGPVLGVQALTDDAMDVLLSASFHLLGPEARRFVRDHSHGAPAWAIWLAAAVQRTPDAQAADMISRGDIEEFITAFLPEGSDFFFAAVLALFERVGWDRDLRTQMELLAEFANATPADFEHTLRYLASHDLVRRQGRYRAVDPLPVAIYLAAQGWRDYGRRIVEELLPLLDDEMAIALFRRLAQLGRFEPAREVLNGLLDTAGPFGSLQTVDDLDRGALLTQLAIVLPDEVMRHLTLLIDEVSVDQLAHMKRSRRQLVWTLEKLVWHTRTFERAADALLKLALAENEGYSNNATGTWIDLFGGLLPGTAATPAQRVAYLDRVSSDPRPTVRALAIEAMNKGLRVDRGIIISGEIQGGVLVEPRGGAQTWIDLGDYHRALLHTLERLRTDPEPANADAATKALLSAVHPLIDNPLVGDDLAEILSTFTGEALRQLRVDIEQLSSMYSQQDDTDEDRVIVGALEALRNRLPPPDHRDELFVLLQLRQWDLEEGALQQRVSEAVRQLPQEDRIGLINLLDHEVPAAWELGRALAASEQTPNEYIAPLTDHFDANPNALVGYLHGLVDSGDNDAFDRFLEGPHADRLEPRIRLNLAVRGPVTDSSRHRIVDGVATLPVRDAAAVMFGWARNLSTHDTAHMVEDWIARTTTQDDYNAAVDWLNITLLNIPAPPELLDPIWQLVQGRATYPKMGRDAGDWVTLASRVVDEHALDLLTLMLDLIEHDRLMIHSGDPEAALIGLCLKRRPVEGWNELGERLEDPAAWRIPMQLRGWVQFSMPIEVLDAWIGQDIDRARTVAAITSPGGAEPTDLAVLLLDRFGNDEQISVSLRATFVSGAWWGPWSNRVTGQIDQLTGWQDNTELPVPVRRWAKNMVESLRLERDAALEREAEQGE
jgi:hypothetical protein